MKKIRLALALAGLFVVSTARSSAVTITQDFSANPKFDGWKIFGDSSFFIWNPANQNLEVTWNSSQTNSYFYRPLGTTLTKDDDFSFAFDLRLDDIGPASGFDYSFQFGIGLLNIDQAKSPGFLRGTGFNATNLVEWAYFRSDPYFSPDTVYPTFVDRDGGFNYNPGGTDSTNYSLALGDGSHVVMNYTASNQTMVMVLTNLASGSHARVSHRLGNVFGGSAFTDFRVNAISINSYSDAGQFPGFEGSVLAHGTVDNFVVTLPSPPVENVTGLFSNAVWSVQFQSRPNWSYTLERTSDFQSWTNVAAAVATSAGLSLQDTNSLPGKAFYRVKAERH